MVREVGPAGYIAPTTYACVCVSPALRRQDSSIAASMRGLGSTVQQVLEHGAKHELADEVGERNSH